MAQQRATVQEVLASPVRRDIIDTLVNLPDQPTDLQPYSRELGMPADKLAKRLGRHVTTIRFHLDQLVQSGLIAVTDMRSGVGRPRRYYRASPGPITPADPEEGFRLLAELFAQAMTDGITSAEDAGRHWVASHAIELLSKCASTEPATSAGTWLAKLGIVLDMLQRWGYDPSVRTSDAGRTAELSFTHCPFRELARRNPGVACSIHRGLVQGTLELLGEGAAELRVTPFVEPDLCTARITTKTPFMPQGGTDDRHETTS